MLSIILADRDDLAVVDYTEEMLEDQISRMDAEIIRATSWRTGLEMSEGDFLCYVEPDCLLSEDFFMVSLNTMASSAQYRKLAMVSPVLCARRWEREIYGYKEELGQIVPVIPETDRKKYLPSFKQKLSAIQIGYLPGSIIRRSAAERLYFNSDVPLKSSVENSLALWEEGNRILLNPYSKYVSNEQGLDESIPYGRVSAKVSQMFERELI